MSAPHLAAEALSTWDANAKYWDDGVGEDGNKYWKRLQLPCLERLLGDRLSTPGCRALDVACGNGLCSRWMLSNGASVVTTDGSEEMLKNAKKRSPEGAKVSFQKLDVTKMSDFEMLPGFGRDNGGFDVILMNMAMMDVADIEPLAHALPKILKKNGVFVATLLHPAYWTNNASRNIEIDYDPVTSERRVVLTRVVKDYLDIKPVKGIFNPGQPVPQIYFHRPLHELFSTFFKAGLVMDAMEEPAFTAEDFDKNRVEASCNYTQIPALLAFRLRLAV